MKTIPMAVFTVTMLLVVLVKPVIVTAQYQTPPPLGTLTNENNTPNFNNTNVYDKTYYQTHPILGWNWGGNGSNFDNALHTNTAHTKFLYHPIHWFPTNYINEFNNTVFPDSTRLILYLDFKGGSTDDTIRKYYQPMVNCIAQQIEPTIAVQESQAFTPRPADKEGGVFGFKTKNKVRILTDTTQIDYPRVLLDKDSITTPALVLSTLWRPDVLRFLSYGLHCTSMGPPTSLIDTLDRVGDVYWDPLGDVYKTNLKLTRDSVNGRTWILSVNLRCRENIPSNLRNTTILSITLPAVLRNPTNNTFSNTNIRFNRFSGGDTVHIRGSRGDYRGLARNLTVNANGTTTWNITGEMFALGTGTAADSSITLSAEFICDDRDFTPINHNKIFRPETESRGFDVIHNVTRTAPYIDSIDVRVTYHGNLDVAVDWLRFETPMSQKLFRGHYDSHYRNMITAMETLFNTINTNNPNRALRVMGIYGMEERNALWWWHNRYQNQVTNGLTIEESAPKFETYTAHALHAKGYYAYWNGANIQFQNDIAAPFYRYGSVGTHRAFGQQRGYLSNAEVDNNNNKYYDTDNVDSLHSNYETRYDTKFPNRSTRQSLTTIPLPFNPYQERFTWNGASTDTLIFLVGTQAKIEKDIYNSYYIPHGFIYSGKPWLANIWLSTEYWRLDTAAPQGPMAYQDGGERPKTGEEVSLMERFPLLLGAKGLMYYYMGTTPGNNVYTSTFPNINFDLNGFTLGFWMANPTHNLQGNALLRSDNIGGDWVNRNDADTIRWHNYMNTSYYWLNDMHTDMDHFYLGMKSLRVESERNNKWFMDNGSELLRLSLQAWYGKGFMKLYTQHPSLNSNDSVLKNFVNIGAISTRPIGRVNGQNQPLYENAVAGKDSCFYDVTLLKRDTFSTDSVFYLGVQNRRTDALWRDANYANGEMIFVPTAEWDALMQNGGTYWRDASSHTAAWWRDKYWKRQGCREITIPFNYTPPDNEPRLLHVQEVGGSLDTIVRVNGKLALRFTPGEGKLLRVTVQYARATVANGELNNSNQSKLVAFPLMRENLTTCSLVPTDSVIYYMTYVVRDFQTNDQQVYYRRSIPYSQKNTNTMGLQWLPEVCLSCNGISKLDGRTEILQCGVPTLVVRIDSADRSVSPIGCITGIPQVKSYIVYGCADTQDSSKFRIAENVLYAQDTVMNPGLARELDSAYGKRDPLALSDYDFINTWASPAINASSQGNYYAYSDSLLGIVTRWKPADVFLFNNNRSDMSSVRFSTTVLTDCLHPSLNTYSRIGLWENECALVWEEHGRPEAPSNVIPYTRIQLVPRFSPPQTQHFLSKNLTNFAQFRSQCNADSSVVLMSIDTIDYKEFPMVYHGVENYQIQNPTPLVTRHWDKVLWQNYRYDTVYHRELNLRGVNSQDSCATTDAGWNVWWLEKIWSENYSLTHPNIAQGGGVKIDPNDNATNISDSSVVINFSINPPHDTRIMQLQCGYWSVSPNFNLLSLESLGNDNAFKPYIQDLGLGAYPHISAQPSVTNSSSWTINRRIYTPDWESTSIISSADYFYKKKTEDVNKPLRYSGYYFERDSNKVVKTLLSTTKVGSQEVQFTPRHTVNGTTVEAKTDTVYSTWFQVGNISTLDSYVLGINNPCVKIEVERRREGNNDPIERFLLPYISSRSDKEKLKHRYILHRGGNKYYRIALINTCSERMKFTEEIQIDGLTAQDELGKQNVAEEFTNTIDLGNGTLNDGVLFLKPNPADQLVQVTFNGLLEDIDTYNFDYNYEVVDNLGRVKQKGLIRAGEIIQVNTSQFNQGSYLVRVRGSASSTSKPFVIIR